MKKILACALFVGAVAPLSATAGTYTLAQFSGPGIGVIPWGPGSPERAATPAIPAAPERNVVRGVPPANEVWRVGNISASVKSDGTISVDAAGLLVASGNQIGTNGGGSPFQASLNCANEPLVFRTTTDFYLSDASGKLVIRGKLSDLPMPSVCQNPVLLIGGFGHGGWVAAANPLP